MDKTLIELDDIDCLLQPLAPPVELVTKNHQGLEFPFQILPARPYQVTIIFI